MIDCFAACMVVFALCYIIEGLWLSSIYIICGIVQTLEGRGDCCVVRIRAVGVTAVF